MDLMPILATLKRHKTAAGLIVLQVALTCAIVSNALFMIFQRLERINAPSGLAEQEIISLRISSLTPNPNFVALTRADLQALEKVEGVKARTMISTVPFGDSHQMTSAKLTADENEIGINVSTYRGSEGWLQTLGLKLIAGRDFTADEYRDESVDGEDDGNPVKAIVINKALADRLFNGDALGKSIYTDGDVPKRVVGVLEQLISAQPTGDGEQGRYAVFSPERPSYRSGNFLLRTSPEARDRVMKAAIAALAQNDPLRIVREKNKLSDMREAYYRQDSFMVWLLISVCIALLIVTAFGIVGLASFWVQQRTKMIGTRRALGATRGQILRYFQAENFLLSTMGIVLGVAAAFGISLMLMKFYEMPRLPLVYVPVSALALWALGQLAVWSPARRAAALPPVAALRGA
ncbi:FtsX-like permease family protein [Paucibacter sp. APW11]|uniref:FtsX-like permease family protein n=1 Tax=Roseateles aquae TaxID=3077235 RepID=A0ABU3PH85_9BURK|nr:FtsX-like permease family protein [Paucibacter sp. APW11]MDT9001814.1 FtsX-like permease family protein [Paucibacter sp. APW11]